MNVEETERCSRGATDLTGYAVDALQRGNGTRRTLLSRVLAGLALAAPSLLLPETLTEVAAREGVLGGKFGGRHGPNRRGRDKGKRRDNNQNNKGSGNKKGKNKDGKPPGGAPPINVQMTLQNQTNAAIDIDGWSADFSPGSNVPCQKVFLKTIDPNDSVLFQPNEPYAYAVFFYDTDTHDQQFLVEVRQTKGSRFPEVFVSHNGKMGTGSGCASSFEDVVKNRQLEVGQSFNATVDGHKFNIAREADVDGNRSFVIKVLS